MSINVNFKTKKRMIVASMELSQQEHYLGSISDNVSDSTLVCFKSDMYTLAKRLVSLNSELEVQETTDGYLDLSGGECDTTQSSSQNINQDQQFQPNLVITESQDVLKPYFSSMETMAFMTSGDNPLSKPANNDRLHEVLEAAPAEFVKFVLSYGKTGLSKLHRRYWTKEVPDAFGFSVGGSIAYRATTATNKQIAMSIINRIRSKMPSVQIDDTCNDLLVELIAVARNHSSRVKRGSMSINWAEVIKQKLGDEVFSKYKSLLTPINEKASKSPRSKVTKEERSIHEAETTTSPESSSEETVLQVGFTTKQAISKIDSLPYGSEFARRHWPWFFDESGKFDLLQLARRGDVYSILANVRSKNNRYKRPAKRTPIEVQCTYESVRNIVAMAYASAVMGTGINNYEKVEEQFKAYCDAFTVAVITELNLVVIATDDEKTKLAKAKLAPTYLNFENETDVDVIIEQLTYPSGRLRVINVGKSSEGVFWYVRSNKVGMGADIKPKRLRFTEKPLDEQLVEFINEIKQKTNLPDLPGLKSKLRELMIIEAGRVKSDLV